MKRLTWMCATAFFIAAVGGQAGAVEIPQGLLFPFEPPLPERIEDPDNPATQEQIDLGRMLYYDPRLSLGQNISCNTCHPLDQFGADGKRVSLGHKEQPGRRNSPTVYNAAGHFAQFWDGRAKTVEEQATMPIFDSVEMAMPDPEYAQKVLKSIPGYVEAFKKAFPDADTPITIDNVGVAIGAFERGLTTPAPWDEFLKGNKNAISDQAKQGFMTFATRGCITCHMSTYVGGTSFQKLGVIQPWPSQEDQGRFEVTKNPTDKMMFKSASLRNVTKTAPYFHDGSEDSLEEAIRIMARYQLGQQFSDQDVANIIAWFETLTGEIPEEYIKEPELPESGPDTPAPRLD